MKNILLLLFSLFFSTGIFGQEYSREIEHIAFDTSTLSTENINKLISFAKSQTPIQPFTSDTIIHIAYRMAQRKGDSALIGKCYDVLGNLYAYSGQFEDGLEYAFRGLHINDSLNDELSVVNSRLNIGGIYRMAGNYPTAVGYLSSGLNYCVEHGKVTLAAYVRESLAGCYRELKKFDSALIFAFESKDTFIKIRDTLGLARSLSMIGDIYHNKGDLSLSVLNLRNALNLYMTMPKSASLVDALNHISRSFLHIKQYDSCIYFAKIAFHYSYDLNYPSGGSNASQVLFQSYDSLKNIDSANEYRKIELLLRDKHFDMKNVAKMQNSTADDAIWKKNLEELRNELEQKRKESLYLLYTLASIIIIVAVYIFTISKPTLSDKKIKYFRIVLVFSIYELILLLVHKFLEGITHHFLPAMLIGLVIVGLVLSHFHHAMDDFFSELAAKNKPKRQLKSS